MKPWEDGLNIGVKNDLNPYRVDLKALTRGLVVVGQSGCGKSFLIGRLLEEIVRCTTNMTQIIMIDHNSDFSSGLKLKSELEFKNILVAYNTGRAGKNYRDFRARELESFHDLAARGDFINAALFGRTLRFNLSWDWIREDITRYLQLFKVNAYSTGYPWALAAVFGRMDDKTEKTLGDFIQCCFDSMDDVVAPKSDGKRIRLPREVAEHYSLATVQDYRDILTDTLMALMGGIWRSKNDDMGIPESLFTNSRVSFLEVENLPELENEWRVVAYVLFFCLCEHMKHVEDYRKTVDGADRSKIEEARANLKHTFILIDEAQNYAPDETSDPYLAMLAELIHRIAAEGRKYGLHLILATQRPNKIKRGLLGECDNAIIMKMNSRSDLEHLAREMRILDVKLLDTCLHFQGQGNAIAVGEMTGQAPNVQSFKTAPRRSIEGGVDIPDF